MALFFTLSLSIEPLYAARPGVKEGVSSFLLPTTGQSMNGEIGSTKTKIMAGVEVASITAIAILGTVSSGGAVWFGIAPLLANHTWSGVDAYRTARGGPDAMMAMQMNDPQRTMEYARMRRYQREEDFRGDLRTRVQQAGEVGYRV